MTEDQISNWEYWAKKLLFPLKFKVSSINYLSRPGTKDSKRNKFCDAKNVRLLATVTWHQIFLRLLVLSTLNLSAGKALHLKVTLRSLPFRLSCMAFFTEVSLLQKFSRDEAAEATSLTALLASLPLNPNKPYSLDAPRILQDLQLADAVQILQSLFIEASERPHAR